MPRPTEPVRRICYADNITVWATGVKNLGTREKSKYIVYGDVPVLMGKLAFDISTKVITNLVYARPGAGQYPPEDQDCYLRTSPSPQPQDNRSVSRYPRFI